MKNTMKTTIVFAVMALIALSFAVPAVVAEDAVIADAAENVTLVEPGISPDSALYGLDKAIERISMALTFDKAKRAEKALANAEERLAEVKAMVDANKLDKAEVAQKGHEEDVAEAEKDVEEIESDGDAEKAKKALEDVSKVQKEILTHSQKVAAVKDRILAMMAEKNMSADKIARITAVFDKIKAKAVEMENKSLQKKEQVKTKYKTLAGKTDAEVEEVESEIDAETGLDVAAEKSKGKSAENKTGATATEGEAEE